MGTFFTSDTHGGHARLIENGSRAFADVAAMDRAIVDGWNARVGHDDVVYHLGDVSAYRDGRLAGFFHRLNGRKRLVIGNHDEESPEVLALPWDEPPEKHALLHVDGKPVFVCHYPMATWPRIAKGAIHLFGHMHAKWRGDSRRVNVGVDVWDYGPVTLGEIERRAKTLPRFKGLVPGEA